MTICCPSSLIRMRLPWGFTRQSGLRVRVAGYTTASKRFSIHETRDFPAANCQEKRTAMSYQVINI